MFQNRSKEKVIAFVNKAKELNLTRKDETLDNFIKEVFELIEHNEYGIGLENLLENLYEYKIILNKDLIQKAKVAILEMGIDWKDWRFVEELIQAKTLSVRFQEYIRVMKTIHLNDSFASYKKWDELIEMLSEDETGTITLLNLASKEDIDYISEVMEEVAEKLNSENYINALKRASKKYPECNLNDIIRIAISHMQSKNDV